MSGCTTSCSWAAANPWTITNRWCAFCGSFPIRYTIREALDACRYYLEKTGRRIVVEYALIDRMNADESCAEELARILRGMQCHVNLIPLNTVKERNLFGVTEEQVKKFLDVLEKRHISATRRREMGDDIEGACGQLRKKILQEGQA